MVFDLKGNLVRESPTPAVYEFDSKFDKAIENISVDLLADNDELNEVIDVGYEYETQLEEVHSYFRSRLGSCRMREDEVVKEIDFIENIGKLLGYNNEQTRST